MKQLYRKPDLRIVRMDGADIVTLSAFDEGVGEKGDE